MTEQSPHRAMRVNRTLAASWLSYSAAMYQTVAAGQAAFALPRSAIAVSVSNADFKVLLCAAAAVQHIRHTADAKADASQTG